MGIEDRDYYWDKRRDDSPFSPPAKKRALKDWLYMALVWVGLLLLLVKAATYFFPKEMARLKRLEVRSAVVVAPSMQTQPEPSPSIQREAPAPVRQLNSHSDAQWPAEVQTQTPLAQAPTTTTIYLCKAYTGGLFWSSAHCNTQRALIDRTATVPTSLSFDQQVQLADAQRKEAESLYHQQPAPAVQVASRCMVLRAERESIDARYANWKWQPPEVINPDQIRMRALREEQSRLGCPDR